MSLCAHAVKDKATARYKRVIRIYMYAMHVLPGGITCRVKLPLSQLAPDRFKTLCDRKFSSRTSCRFRYTMRRICFMRQNGLT